MRTDLRTVIREIYVAYDGTEFDNMDECTKYENNSIEKLKLEAVLKPYLIRKSTEDMLWSKWGDSGHDLHVYNITCSYVAEKLAMYIHLCDTSKPENFYLSKYVGLHLNVLWNCDHSYCWFFTLDELLDEIKDNYNKNIMNI